MNKVFLAADLSAAKNIYPDDEAADKLKGSMDELHDLMKTMRRTKGLMQPLVTLYAAGKSGGAANVSM